MVSGKINDHFVRMRDEYMPRPYWPDNMPEGEKAVRIKLWEREIFPIWKGIEKRDMERSERGEDLAFCETGHKQDLAIYDNGNRINRIWADPSKRQSKSADTRLMRSGAFPGELVD